MSYLFKAPFIWLCVYIYNMYIYMYMIFYNYMCEGVCIYDICILYVYIYICEAMCM